LPKWTIGHTGHGRDDQIVLQSERTDVHRADFWERAPL
jgi:hypothetical protein